MRPGDLGVDSLVYPQWYPGQEDTFLWLQERIADTSPSSPRILGVSKPTGSGKSLDGWLPPLSLGLRAAYLMGTKALQTQYARTVGSATMTATVSEVKGQNAYPCILVPGMQVDAGPCHAGYRCPYAGGGCEYFDAREQANQSQMVITNYSYWMSIHKYGEGLGKTKPFDVLVCDEADTIFDTVSSFLTVQIVRADCRRLIGLDIPGESEGMDGVKQWIQQAKPRAAQQQARIMSQLEIKASSGGQLTSADTRAKKEIEALVGAIGDIEKAVRPETQDQWVLSWGARGGWFQAAPVWPSDYLEDVLFMGIKKIVLLSATLTHKTMELLGVEQAIEAVVDEDTGIEIAPRVSVPVTNRGDGSDFIEFPSMIPVENRRIKHLNTCAMSRNRVNYPLWVATIDQIVAGRMDRKVLVHTTSYERRDRYIMGSKYAGTGMLLSHGAGDAEEVIERWRRMEPPAVLVSPSIVRGYDFPGIECECVIIGKVPFPDGRDPVVKARSERWPDYGMYVAMMSLIQEAGRHIRNPQDRGETLIVDDDWKWFWRKFQEFIPQYFLEAIQWKSEIMIPVPPKSQRLG